MIKLILALPILIIPLNKLSDPAGQVVELDLA